MRLFSTAVFAILLAVSLDAATKKVIHPKEFPQGRPFSPGIIWYVQPSEEPDGTPDGPANFVVDQSDQELPTQRSSEAPAGDRTWPLSGR